MCDWNLYTTSQRNNLTWDSSWDSGDYKKSDAIQIQAFVPQGSTVFSYVQQGHSPMLGELIV